MPLDPEIDEVEARIVHRRHYLTRVAKESGDRAVQMLASPGALAGAAALGFLVGGGAVRRHRDHAGARSGRRRNDPASRAAKRTGVIGALVTGAMWLVRARFGSAAGLAHYILERGGRRPPLRRPEATAGRPSYR
jgi:hypothetical protein